MKRFVALSIFGFLALLATSTYAQAVFMPAMQGVQYRRASAVVETRSVSISSSTVVEAVVNITAPAGTTLSERGVCWSTNPNPTIANFKSAYGSTSLGTATSNITSMATGNIYYVRGYATVGGSTYYGNELPMAIFYSNGADQSFTVPAGVTSATIKVLGAAGGESTLSGTPTAYGGYGASMMGTFTVTPGESISVIVGEKGVDGSYYVVK
ncbi:hypothetical protein, partial [Pararcticibacter amylolyticus]|uniref:hypothetical protein n=1 Tax=Pararcticibacter amylolyticus TaxID=2173175 RepID=UPI00192E3D70